MREFLTEEISHIRDFNILSVLVITAQLEDQSFDVRPDSLLGDLFNGLRHSAGEKINGNEEKSVEQKSPGR